MRWHREKKLLYLAHPKTASVSTTAVLDELGFENPGRMHHHARLCELDADVSDFTKFTTIRDHRDALVSWWHVQNHQLPFSPNWLDWFTTTPSVARYLRPGQLWWMHTQEADVILRFEDLSRQLNSLLTDYGFPSITLPAINVSKQRAQRHWQEFYSEEMLSAVYDIYGPEMEQFGYL